MIFAFVINETSNLKLYRNRDFAFQKVALKSYTAYFVTSGREEFCSVVMLTLPAHPPVTRHK